jgi:rsbT co-antagonist protein RsbR
MAAATTSHSPPRDYYDFLQAQRPALIELIADDCAAEIELYRMLPTGHVRQSADSILEVLFESLMSGDVDALTRRIEQVLRLRISQGLRFEQAMLLPTIFRRQLLRASLPALAERVAGSDQGLLFVSQACDNATFQIGEFYRQHLEQANAELRRFKALAENVIDGIAASDARMQIVYANPAFRELVGFDDAILGQPINAVHDPAEHERVNNVIVPELLREGSWRGTLNYRHTSGETFPVQLSVVTLTNDSGDFDGSVAVVRDMRQQQAREARLRMFESLVENSIDGVVVSDLDGIIRYVNPAALRINGFGSAGALLGRPRSTLIAPEESERLASEIAPALRLHGSWQGRIWAQRPDASQWLAQSSTFLLTDAGGAPNAIGAISRDVTAEYQAENERAQFQEELIRTQEAVLRELSTPLIPISDHVMVLPLIGSVDTRRAQQVIDTLLHDISKTRARVAIIDITGVPVVDTQVANALLRAAQSVRLLGSRVVITGIRPEVAQTLVGLGADLGGIATRSTLQSAIASAIRDS